MTPEQCTTAVTAYLAGRMRPAVESVASEIAADIRERINVPVGRSGGRIIRSKPGEPPRREYGDLYKSVGTVAGGQGDQIEAIAGSTSKIAVYLEYGTGTVAPRPHFTPAFLQAQLGIADRIKSKL